MKSITAKSICKIAILVLGLIILARFFCVVSSIIISLALAVIFASALDYPVSFLETKKINRGLGSFLCIMVILFLGISMVRIISPMFSAQWSQLITEAPKVAGQLDKKVDSLCDELRIDRKTIKISKLGVETDALIKGAAQKAALFSISAVSVITNIFLVVVFTVYILIEPRPLIRGVMHPWPMNIRKKIRRSMLRIQKAVLYWGIGLMLGSFCIFLLTWLGLVLIKMPNAFLFAVIAGIMNIIPTLGPIMSAVPPLIIALITNPVMILKVIIVYIIVQQCEGHLVTPLVMQKQLSIHPVVLLFSIFVMGTFFGLAGIFITAPVIASAGIIYDEFYAKEFRNTGRA